MVPVTGKSSSFLIDLFWAGLWDRARCMWCGFFEFFGATLRMAKARKAAIGPRIRSGGQTGVDRAALDAAMVAGWPYEGWCPKGGLAEDFVDPPGLLTKYPCLQETPSEFPRQRTEWNVRDSMARVVLVPHVQFSSPGTDFTIACAKKYGRPCTIIRYLDQGAAAELEDVISSLQAGTSVNIAGPRDSEHPGAYDLCLPLLVRALALGGRRGERSAPHSIN
jgi:Circularly permutated YpsA SLOG family